MNKVCAVVAIDENNGIGYKNGLPWRNRSEMKLFRKITKNSVVIMGRRTWDSLPKKPLKNRINVVITSHYVNEGITTYDNLKAAVRHARGTMLPVYIIGGQSIYEQAFRFNLVDEIRISRIHSVHKCDTYFSIPRNFTLDTSQTVQHDSFTHSVWIRD